MSKGILTDQAEARRGGARALLPGSLGIATLGPVIALLLASAFFAARTDRFLTGENLSLVVQQVIEVGTLGIGQTLVILTAGIDLSNGAVMAFGTILMTDLAVNHGLNPYVAIVLGI